MTTETESLCSSCGSPALRLIHGKTAEIAFVCSSRACSNHTSWHTNEAAAKHEWNSVCYTDAEEIKLLRAALIDAIVSFEIGQATQFRKQYAELIARAWDATQEGGTVDEPIDWRSVLVRYATATMDDDVTIGHRCLIPDTAWSPDWTEAEREALIAVHQEAWPKGAAFEPWSLDFFNDKRWT